MNKQFWGKRKGFTIVEIIIGITVLAILAAVAIPTYVNISKKAKEKVDVANAVTIAIAINANNTMYEGKESKLISSVPVDSEVLSKVLGDFRVTLSAEDTDIALGLITITDHVATVEAALEMGSDDATATSAPAKSAKPTV